MPTSNCLHTNAVSGRESVLSEARDTGLVFSDSLYNRPVCMLSYAAYEVYCKCEREVLLFEVRCKTGLANPNFSSINTLYLVLNIYYLLKCANLFYWVFFSSPWVSGGPATLWFSVPKNP